MLRARGRIGFLQLRFGTIAAALGVACTAAAPVHADVVTAEYIPTSTNTEGFIGSLVDNRWQGETFLATVAGPLQSLSARVVRFSGGPLAEDLIFDAYSVTGGLPDVLLGSAIVLASDIPTNAPVMAVADFSGSGILIQDGQRYAIALRVAVLGEQDAYAFLGRSPGGYPDGNRIFSANEGVDWSGLENTDFVFRATVPEPSTLVLLLIGSRAAVRRRRMRR